MVLRFYQRWDAAANHQHSVAILDAVQILPEHSRQVLWWKSRVLSENFREKLDETLWVAIEGIYPGVGIIFARKLSFSPVVFRSV